MIRLLLSSIACALAVTSCGPLDGGDPLDGPPGNDGASLHLRSTPEESGTNRSIGVEGRHDRYSR
ncbi:MAG: hypothetical protein EOP87_10995 [Verrucomicrobiaceae bacterium]|nr:MAG: hypothetical protein EOP87_10995 [Verrucomicrobiaceae bacterium]